MLLILLTLLAHADEITTGEYRKWWEAREREMHQKCPQESQLLELKEETSRCEKTKGCRDTERGKNQARKFAALKTEFVKCVREADAAYEKAHPQPPKKPKP